MERLSSADRLRACADALEDKRQLANVEGIRRRSDLDQDLLLVVSRMTGKRSGDKKSLPDAGTIAERLKERVVEVSTFDKQSAILGIFYTTLYPLGRHQQVVAGIFPLYSDKVEYVIRPEISSDGFAGGSALVKQESASEENPFLIHNSKFPSLLFFRESPFKTNHPYGLTPAEEEKYWHEDIVLPNKMSLEENLLKIILKNKNPFLAKRLFRQVGFAAFINSRCSDPKYMEKYMELHTAFTQFRHRKPKAE